MNNSHLLCALDQNHFPVPDTRPIRSQPQILASKTVINYLFIFSLFFYLRSNTVKEIHKSWLLYIWETVTFS